MYAQGQIHVRGSDENTRYLPADGQHIMTMTIASSELIQRFRQSATTNLLIVSGDDDPFSEQCTGPGIAILTGGFETSRHTVIHNDTTCTEQSSKNVFN